MSPLQLIRFLIEFYSICKSMGFVKVTYINDIYTIQKGGRRFTHYANDLGFKFKEVCYINPLLSDRNIRVLSNIVDQYSEFLISITPQPLWNRMKIKIFDKRGVLVRKVKIKMASINFKRGITYHA